MSNSSMEILTTPRRDELDLVRIANGAGFSVSVLPSGAIFAIEHTEAERRIVDQPGARLADRRRHGAPFPAHRRSSAGNRARHRSRSWPSRRGSDDRFVWEGDRAASGHRVTLWLHPRRAHGSGGRIVATGATASSPATPSLIQDLGLGDQGFLMNNEAYASQYLDHHVAQHPRLNHVVMSRQNLSARGSAFPGSRTAALKAPPASRPIFAT